MNFYLAVFYIALIVLYIQIDGVKVENQRGFNDQGIGF